MRDTRSQIYQAYYDALSTLSYPVYEGEEPDDVKDKLYIVIQDATGTETSTSNSSDEQLTVQISVHSWEYKYNNTKQINTAVNDILGVIKPTPNSVLDLSAYDLQMMNLSIQTDRTERYGEMGGRVYISRILVMKQDIFVIS